MLKKKIVSWGQIVLEKMGLEGRFQPQRLLFVAVTMAAPTTIVGFHWADYLVFSTVLLISASIGLFAAIKHRNAPAEHLLTANRKLPLLPVALSLAASFMSAIFVLGVPAEAYLNSTEYWWIGLGYIPAEIITCLLIMPVFYKLKLTSAYQVGILLLE